PEYELSPRNIIPPPLNFRGAPEVAAAVARAALRSGTARRRVDPRQILENTRDFLYGGTLAALAGEAIAEEPQLPLKPCGRPCGFRAVLGVEIAALGDERPKAGTGEAEAGAMRRIVTNAAWLLAALLADLAVCSPPRAEVTRLEPKTLYLRTNMDVKTPLYLYAPTGPRPDYAARRVAIILFSGDAGWRPLQEDSASYLAAKGRYVLGVDATSYFRKSLEREEWTEDLTALRSLLNEQAGRPREAPLVLGGFFFGARMVPFMINRAGAAGVMGTLLIAPDRHGVEVYRLSVMLKLPGA